MTSRTAVRRAQAAAEPPSRRRRVGLLAVLALVVVVGIGVVVSLAGSHGDDGSTGGADQLVYGTVHVSGDPLPAFDDGAADPAVGRVAPQVTTDEPDGTLGSVGAQQPTIVAFVAHWCPHCQAEVPRIVAAAKAGTLDGVRLVAVATGTNPDAPNYPPAPWLDRERWPGEVLLDDQGYSAASAFGLAGYPYLVALDAHGTVVARTSGELPDGGLEQLVAAAKAGHPLPG